MTSDHGWWHVAPPDEIASGNYKFQFSWFANFLGVQGMDSDVVYKTIRKSDESEGTVTFHVNCTIWADHENNIGEKRTNCSSDLSFFHCTVEPNGTTRYFELRSW